MSWNFSVSQDNGEQAGKFTSKKYNHQTDLWVGDTDWAGDEERHQFYL